MAKSLLWTGIRRTLIRRYEFELASPIRPAGGFAPRPPGYLQKEEGSGAVCGEGVEVIGEVAGCDVGFAHESVKMLGQRGNAFAIAEGKIVAAHVEGGEERTEDCDRGGEQPTGIKKVNPQARVELIVQLFETIDLGAAGGSRSPAGPGSGASSRRRAAGSAEEWPTVLVCRLRSRCAPWQLSSPGASQAAARRRR